MEENTELRDLFIQNLEEKANNHLALIDKIKNGNLSLVDEEEVEKLYQAFYNDEDVCHKLATRQAKETKN